MPRTDPQVSRRGGQFALVVGKRIRGERGGDVDGSHIDIQRPTAAARGGADQMRRGGDARPAGGIRKLLQERDARRVLRDIAAVELDRSARPQRRADCRQVALVLRDRPGVEDGVAQFERAVAAMRDDVDRGEVADVVARQVVGDLLHAVFVGIEDDRLHARLDRSRKELSVRNIAFDKHDLLAWRRTAGER